ncbi:hypothetical protein P389DRAFT_72994 [Cystobasidium minutum MCA 4210]|uniref:uncharacterized protein n=1 Tax=Cystobasidium minutum MCA 4210 TaxID=1397322 RepID=UPI0034CF2215|eukprot:jgi/Rhomi1/72994/CE72993_3082
MPHLYSPQQLDESSEMFSGMRLPPTAYLVDDDSSNSESRDRQEQQDEEAGGPDMSIEPSAVPPYWSFSTTRSQLVVDERASPSAHSPTMQLPPSNGNSNITAIRNSAGHPGSSTASSGIDEESVLPTMASLLAVRNSHLHPQAPFVHLPPHRHTISESDDQHQQQQHDSNIGEDDGVDVDDDDPSKGLASGPNALPVSPPRRIRRLPTVHQLLDSDNGITDEGCIAACPAGRCTCSRRSSPAPASHNNTSPSPLASSSSTGSATPSSSTFPAASKGSKRKRDTSYIHKCSFLQPGVVFTGSQSFTTFSNAYTHPSAAYPTSSTRDFHRRNYHPYSPVQREPDPLYITSPGVPSRRFLNSALDHLQNLTRHATASLNRPPFSSLAPIPPVPGDAESPWSAIEGSAIDPSMQDLLGGNPSYGYTSGDSIARASNMEEWEVQVSISSVDYIHGRVTGIMTALNVPNSSCLPPTPSSVGPSSASLAKGIDSSNTVTTSFEGEIIDLRNNGIWTRAAPNVDTQTGSYSDMACEGDDEDDEDMSTYASGSSSSCTGGPWLSSNHVVDKSIDLEYWAKLDAFASYGPLAEKEICKIAREGKWPERTQHGHVRRPNPQDYILMRWKERDFIDCDARSSGLTISGFYYLCLNRKTGALSGFYFDPLSTPHQKLELEVARTRCAPDPNTAPTAQQQQGGIWFGSYSVI